MVFVRDLGAMAPADAEPLVAYLAKPNPSTVIVALVSKVDKRQKLYAQLGKLGYLHELLAPKKLAPWVTAEAQTLGVRIDAAAVNRLIDTVGGDLSRLALAVEQLGLFVGGKRPVTSDDVDELIADTRERSVFELTDAIGAADRTRALAAVTSLCDQRESAVGVVVMVARFVRQMSMAHALRRSNTPRNEWPQKIGVPPFIVDKILGQARMYTPEALAVAIQRLAAADRAIKGDLTLSIATSPFTGPQMKALGRELAERVILEHVVDGIVRLAA